MTSDGAGRDLVCISEVARVDAMTPLPESAVSAPDATTERLAAGVLPSGAADAAPSPPREPPAAMAEEVDVWWGSYSGWTLWPSMVLCLLLTGLVGLGGWIGIPGGLHR